MYQKPHISDKMSPDLTPCDFYLWGHLKSKVYQGTIASQTDLKDSTTLNARNITPDQLKAVVKHIATRCQLLTLKQGDNNENHLWICCVIVFANLSFVLATTFLWFNSSQLTKCNLKSLLITPVIFFFFTGWVMSYFPANMKSLRPRHRSPGHSKQGYFKLNHPVLSVFYSYKVYNK